MSDLKEFEVGVSYTTVGKIRVMAASKEEAMEKADEYGHSISDVYDEDYLCDSWSATESEAEVRELGQS